VLELIIAILIIGWLLGFFAFHIGNLIHVLLVIAIIVVLVRIIQGRRPIKRSPNTTPSRRADTRPDRGSPAPSFPASAVVRKAAPAHAKRRNAVILLRLCR